MSGQTVLFLFFKISLLNEHCSGTWICMGHSTKVQQLHERANKANPSWICWTAHSCFGCQNSAESKTVTSTARVEHAEVEIINPLAYEVDKLMVKSKSRWTALTTALNHSVTALMIHGQIFGPRWWLSWCSWMILNENSWFEKRICNMKTLMLRPWTYQYPPIRIFTLFTFFSHLTGQSYCALTTLLAASTKAVFWCAGVFVICLLWLFISQLNININLYMYVRKDQSCYSRTRKSKEHLSVYLNPSWRNTLKKSQHKPDEWKWI